MFRRMTSWYWPTSSERGEATERALLKGLDLEFKNVQVSPNSFIHCAYNAKGTRKIPVVMVHGLGAGLAFYYKNVQPLIDEGWKVYMFDWLGMGRSGRPPFPTYPTNSIETVIAFFIESFEEWRRKMGLDRFILIGHSLGGYLSALFALKHPNQVHCLILSSPVGLPKSDTKEGEETERILSVTGHEVPGWLVALWNRNYTPQSIVRGMGPIGPRLTTSYVNARFSYLSEAEKLMLADYLYQITADVGSGEYALGGILMPGAWAREPLHDRLPSLSMTCHFVYGEVDWMDYRHAMEAIERMTVRTSITRIPGAGHHVYLDNPGAYNEAILRIINEHC